MATITRERVYVDIPQTDIPFFQLFADRMGWPVAGRQRVWAEYIKNSPQNADISDEEIVEEVRAERYGKVQDNY
jgi:hypothetical protein